MRVHVHVQLISQVVIVSAVFMLTAACGAKAPPGRTDGGGGAGTAVPINANPTGGASVAAQGALAARYLPLQVGARWVVKVTDPTGSAFKVSTIETQEVAPGTSIDSFRLKEVVGTGLGHTLDWDQDTGMVTSRLPPCLVIPGSLSTTSPSTMPRTPSSWFATRGGERAVLIRRVRFSSTPSTAR